MALGLTIAVNIWELGWGRGCGLVFVVQIQVKRRHDLAFRRAGGYRMGKCRYNIFFTGNERLCNKDSHYSYHFTGHCRYL
jgi:hypothetical protein